MNRRKSKILVGVLAAVLALAVAVPAFAGTDDTSTQAVTRGNEAWGGGQGHGGIRGLGAGGQMSVRISESLGIESADLAAEGPLPLSEETRAPGGSRRWPPSFP